MINNHLQEISYLLMSFMIIGVVACSISGALRAAEARMDITGAILLAFITSNAGGTVRDIILGSKVFWITDQFYIWLTFIIGALTYIFIYHKRKVLGSQRLHTMLIVTDAMGLAAFSLAGVEKSIVFGQNGVIAVIFGIWTAIGGGVLADIISNRIPLVFSQELYITVAFVGSLAYYLMYGHMNHVVAGMIAAIMMILLRLYSVKYNWKFPAIYQ